MTRFERTPLIRAAGILFHSFHKILEIEMITTFKQAVAVQERRVKTGARGYAKAVRRFLMRDLKGKERPKGYANGIPVVWASVKHTATP